MKLRWSIELMNGLVYAHSKHVAHRDLKPSNIYLYENNNRQLSLKLGDFGLSKEMLNSCLKSLVGTLNYMSPQLIACQAYTFKTDVW